MSTSSPEFPKLSKEPQFRHLSNLTGGTTGTGDSPLESPLFFSLELVSFFFAGFFFRGALAAGLFESLRIALLLIQHELRALR